jgi:hypothetical protein
MTDEPWQICTKIMSAFLYFNLPACHNSRANLLIEKYILIFPVAGTNAANFLDKR